MSFRLASISQKYLAKVLREWVNLLPCIKYPTDKFFLVVIFYSYLFKSIL